MANFWDSIKNGADKTNTKTAPAIVDAVASAGNLIADSFKTGARVLSKPLRMMDGKGDAAKGMGKSALNGLDNIGSRGAKIAGGVLSNPVTKPIVAIVAAVAIYKFVKAKITGNREQTELAAKQQQLSTLKAQNGQMVSDYQENSLTKTGHAAAYLAEKGQAQGVGAQR